MHILFSGRGRRIAAYPPQRFCLSRAAPPIPPIQLRGRGPSGPVCRRGADGRVHCRAAALPRLYRGACAALVAGLILSGCNQKVLTYLLCDPTTTDCNQVIASQETKSAALTSARSEDYQPIYRALLQKASTEPEILATAGFFNLIGAGTPQNPAVALSMLRQAENQRADMAYFGLGFALSYGLGTSIDTPASARYYAALGGQWCDAIKGATISFDKLIEAEEKLEA